MAWRWGGKEAPGVELLERKRVGIYDVSILSATDPSALIQWLNENGYNFPEEAEKQAILNEFKEIDSRVDTVGDAKRYLPEKVAEDVAECKSYKESTLNKLAGILEEEEEEERNYWRYRYKYL